MSKLKQVKIPVSINKSSDMELQGWQKEILDQIQMNYKLVRERDGLTKQSEKVMWIEFDDTGRFKERHDEIGLNRSLVMSPFNDFFTRQTTTVTEILEQTEDYVKFKTNNSVYELSKINGNESNK
jgi:3-phenylpropionate/cinnamic acid dioxygenase small subunit